MEDSRIIALFWERSEQAIEETRNKYGCYCHYIAVNILGNASDAEEIVSDTYWKTWNTIPPNRPMSLKHYLRMIVRQLSFNAWEAKNAAKRGAQTTLVLEELSECIPGGDADLADSVALRDALNRFVRGLPKQTRQIFVRRYWYAASVAEIAADYHMKENTVKGLMHRTRKELKAYLEKEGFAL